MQTHESSERIGPGVIVDRYEVLDLLGVGGIAEVYRVRHLQLDSIHALKVLVLDRPSIRRRVLREGQAQSTLRHPNVVQVTDLVIHHGVPALVLEYVAGPSLDRVLAAHRLTVPEVDLLMRGILRGVARSHAVGLVHRDLKPGNVLLAELEGQLVPKITDFGIVKLLAPVDPSRTMAGQPMGTPEYMAPEQFADASRVDVRADVWSLGVLMVELLTGRLPFAGGTPAETFGQMTQGAYRLPVGQFPALPARMREAIAGALQPDPERRTPDVTALLDAWCDGVPDAALGTPWTDGTRRAVRERTPRPIRPSSLSPTDPPPPPFPRGRVGRHLALFAMILSFGGAAALMGMLVGLAVAAP